MPFPYLFNKERNLHTNPKLKMERTDTLEADQEKEKILQQKEKILQLQNTSSWMNQAEGRPTS